MPRINKNQIDNIKNKTTNKIKRRTFKLSKIRIIAFLVCAAILGISFLFVKPLEKLINFSKPINENAIVSEDDLKIHYIDVGQGDAIFIELPDQKNMMIDAGPNSSSMELINYINNVIFSEKSEDIDYFILTHSDEDHVGGATKILNEFDISTIYRPKIYTSTEEHPSTALIKDTKTYKSFIAAMNSETDDIIISQAGLTISGEGYTFTFYSPIANDYSEPNNYSPIIILEYNGKKFMFTGDAETAIEDDEISTYSIDMDVDVLKVGHHGSSGASSTAFLNKITPEYAVISCGEGNKYNHPHEETLTRLENVGAEVLRTDLSGSIMFFVTYAGEMNYVADVYVPNSYYIEWWYVAVALGGVVVFLCFFSKKWNLSNKK